MKYSAYLFDFDGTLVDSMPSYASAMLRILDDNDIKYDSDLIKVITPPLAMRAQRIITQTPLGLICRRIK